MSTPEETRRFEIEPDENTVFIDLESDTKVIPTPVTSSDDSTTASVDSEPTVAIGEETETPASIGFSKKTQIIAEVPPVITKESDETPAVNHTVRRDSGKSGKGWILWTIAAVVVAGGAIAAVYYLLGREAESTVKTVDPEQTIENDVPGASADAARAVHVFDEVSEYTYGQAIHDATNGRD